MISASSIHGCDILDFSCIGSYAEGSSCSAIELYRRTGISSFPYHTQRGNVQNWGARLLFSHQPKADKQNTGIVRDLSLLPNRNYEIIINDIRTQAEVSLMLGNGFYSPIDFGNRHFVHFSRTDGDDFRYRFYANRDRDSSGMTRMHVGLFFHNNTRFGSLCSIGSLKVRLLDDGDNVQNDEEEKSFIVKQIDLSEAVRIHSLGFECPISLERIERIASTGCHIFNASDLADWMVAQRQRGNRHDCPYCRSVIEEVSTEAPELFRRISSPIF